jgi:hypothetical protein
MSTIVTKVHGYGNEKCPRQRKRTKGNITRERQRDEQQRRRNKGIETKVTMDKEREKRGRDRCPMHAGRGIANTSTPTSKGGHPRPSNA